ncbi:MAG: acyltransferase [Microthrixaceae bacterium]|nr:acyltransferase [Microthrixaceae bacterium]
MRTQAEYGDHFTSVAPKLGHQPPLDGLRGYFMVAVLFAHFSYANFASFAAAVDVFFVVSGFLITTLLLEEDRKSGSISLRNFYKRRALRLLPMLYIVIGVTVVSIFVAMTIYGTNTTAGVPDDITYGQLWEITKSDAVAGAFYVYHVIHPVGIEILTGEFPRDPTSDPAVEPLGGGALLRLRGVDHAVRDPPPARHPVDLRLPGRIRDHLRCTTVRPRGPTHGVVPTTRRHHAGRGPGVPQRQAPGGSPAAPRTHHGSRGHGGRSRLRRHRLRRHFLRQAARRLRAVLPR